MTPFDLELSGRLEELRREGLWRELRTIESSQGPRVEINGKTLINFSSNDYLGLANDPRLKAAAAAAVVRFGAGAGASRLICGSLACHRELDEAIAAFKGVEAALSFSSGYSAALGVICALVGKDNVIVVDKLVHACVVDAARLSGAKLRVFKHNDLNDLEDILKSTVCTPQSPIRTPHSQALVVTESVFSMDGDHAPLGELVQLKDNYGAWLMVDESHATGLYGQNRRGLAEELGVSERIEIQMGTLGKALGAAGGFVCGSRRLIEYLVNRARSFIFSTAPVPAAAAAAAAGVNLVRSASGAELEASLWQRVAELKDSLKNLPPSTADQGPRRPSAIIPMMVGPEARAMEVASTLRDLGIFVPAIRYPTVSRGKARLRITLSAAHTSAEVSQLVQALKAIDLRH